MKKLIFLLILSLIFILNITPVFAQVDDSFNIAINGNAKGYGYTGINTGFGSPDIYQTTIFTPNISNDGYTRTFHFTNSFEINGSTFPLSFVDIYSNDAISSNQCSGVGCNIAYQIPINFTFICNRVNDDYCGLDSLMYPNGNLCPNNEYCSVYNEGSMIRLSDLPNYFEYNSDFEKLYNWLSGNNIQFYYKNMDNRLLSSDSYIDLENTWLIIYNDRISFRTHFGYTPNTNEFTNNLIVKGKIYNNAFSDFESIRIFFNFPYNSINNLYLFDYYMSFTNFNVNTTITGVVPDFPDKPSLSQEEFAELILDEVFNNNDNLLNNSISAFRNLMPFNNSLSDLFYLVPNFLQTLYESNYTCSTFNLGSIYGSNLTLPCINLQNILGSELFHTIDILISIVFIWYFRRVVISSYKSILFLRTGSNGRGDLDD